MEPGIEKSIKFPICLKNELIFLEMIALTIFPFISER